MANRASEEGSGVETRVAVPESKVLAPVTVEQGPGGRVAKQLAVDPPDTSSGTAIATIPGKAPKWSEAVVKGVGVWNQSTSSTDDGLGP